MASTPLLEARRLQSSQVSPDECSLWVYSRGHRMDEDGVWKQGTPHDGGKGAAVYG